MSKEFREIKKLRKEIEELRRDLDRKTVLEPYPVPYPVYPTRHWRGPVCPRPYYEGPYYPFWSITTGGNADQQTYTF
jgi:hypothetical protein